jgi:uncharacterized membrane protein YesL
VALKDRKGEAAVRLIDSKLYQTSETIISYVLLSLLWVLFSLPTVTIFPATAAMFGVVRDWHMQKEVGVVKPFFTHFKNNFKTSIGLSLIWGVILFSLYMNFQMIKPFESAVYFMFMIISVLVTFGFFLTTVYLFPVVVHFELPIIQFVKNAFFIAVGQLRFTIRAVGLLLIAAYLIYKIPILMLFISGFVAYLIYAICYEAFSKVGARY